MTIDKFWDPERKLAIHTSTKEQAELLCRVFNRMGKKWMAGSSYIEDSNWDVFEENTCYLNNNKFSDIDREEENYFVLEFGEIDLDKYLTETEKKERKEEVSTFTNNDEKDL